MFTHVLLTGIIVVAEGALATVACARRGWLHIAVLFVSALGLGAAFAHNRSVAFGLFYAVTCFVIGVALTLALDDEFIERRRRNRMMRRIR